MESIPGNPDRVKYIEISSYEELKVKHKKEVDEFPMAFSFTKEQFADGMRKLGLNPDDTEAVRALPGVAFTVWLM